MPQIADARMRLRANSMSHVELCSRVDALVDPISMGEDAMHGLMCVSHHAYALLEGGGGPAPLREAIATLTETLAGVNGADIALAQLSELAACMPALQA